MPAKQIRAILAIFGLAAFAGGGCGGSGASSASNSSADSAVRAVTVSVSWSSSRAQRAGSRALPESANSVVVTVTDSGGFTDSRLAVRPSASGGAQSSQAVSFFGLRAGVIQIAAAAYTGADGTGQIVDTSETNTSVGAGESGNAAVTFSSVPFATVQITPAAAQTILQGQTYTLTSAGLDSAGNLITSSPSGQWISSNPTVATIGATTGVVTGNYPGSATLTFTDSAYGKSATTSVVVNGGNSTVTIN